MADDEEKKKSTVALPAGLGAGGGVAVGVLIVSLISKLSTDPTKTGDWILDHGLSGVFFVITVCLVLVVWRQAERIEALQEKINDQDRRYAVKVEELMGRLVKQGTRLARLIVKIEASLRKVHLMPDNENEDDEDDLDEDQDDVTDTGATGRVPTGKKH